MPEVEHFPLQNLFLTHHDGMGGQTGVMDTQGGWTHSGWGDKPGGTDTHGESISAICQIVQIIWEY